MVVKNPELCTGCGVCAVVCPKKCIEIKLNEEGFYRPVVDKTRCIECGICEASCNENISHDFSEPIEVKSAILKDKDTLMTVSSGGICYAIAKKTIEDGKKVCAVIYDYSQHVAKHVIIDNDDDLEQTKGSKYLQSYTVDGFEALFNGEKYVVVGTPCQIASIAKVAENKKVRDKLLLLDFFCHGTPTMNVWKKYINEHRGENIKKISFRSKTKGWHNFSLDFVYSDGKGVNDGEKNMFYRMFFNNLCLNDSCYRCKYKAEKSLADIRTGDYWGEKYKENSTGVSCCVVYTEAGKKYLEQLKDVCIFNNESFEDMLVAQMKKSPTVDMKLRQKLINALKGKRKLKTIDNTVLLPYRVKHKIKSLIRRK